MQLTAAGEVFLRYARGVLMDSERAHVEINDLKALRHGHVRLSAIDGIVSGPLSELIAAFRATFPGITFHLNATGTENVMRTIRDGEADIGIAFHSSPLSGVRIAQRIPDPLVAVVARDHPLASRAAASLAEVLAYRIALPERTFGIRQLVNAACHVHQLRPDIVLETNSIEALRGFARSGAGVTMMPYLTAIREIRLGTVAGVLVDETSLRASSLDIGVREDRLLPPAVEEFLRHLCDELKAGDRFQ
jgi:DNA-binding transcriptional LysR family regulator